MEWLPIFVSRKYFEIIYESLKFYNEKGALQVLAYVILENHLHLIIKGSELSRTMRALKSYTARKIIEQLEVDGKAWALNQLAFYKKRHKTQSRYQVWQEGVHPQLIPSDKMLVQKIEYIHLNPVRGGCESSGELAVVQRGGFCGWRVVFKAGALREMAFPSWSLGTRKQGFK